MSVVDQTFSQPAEVRMVLEIVDWDTFVKLPDQRRGSVPRMTYDEGVLEMMTPVHKHESIGRLVGRIVETYSEAKEIEIISTASVTVKRSDLAQAFEADESFYVTHAERLLSKDELDFEVDPPPDLVIEVEITSSAIAKMKLFAKMNAVSFVRYVCLDTLAIRLAAFSIAWGGIVWGP